MSINVVQTAVEERVGYPSQQRAKGDETCQGQQDNTQHPPKKTTPSLVINRILIDGTGIYLFISPEVLFDTRVTYWSQSCDHGPLSFGDELM